MPGLNETNYEAEIQELENDKEFIEKISRIDSISEAAAAFREKGFDILTIVTSCGIKGAEYWISLQTQNRLSHASST